MGDNTQINLQTVPGGDVIATEEVTATTGARGVPGLPASTYKIPRGKVAVGPTDVDMGDATADQPLQVGMREERRQLERIRMVDIDTRNATLTTRARERVTLLDRRGDLISDRGGSR